MKKHYCIENNCNKEVSGKDRRCRSCSKKGILSPLFKINAKTKKKYYCNCKKEITYQSFLYGNKQCGSCASKLLVKNRGGFLGKNNPYFGKRGKLAHNYLHGKYSVNTKHYCQDCHIEISCNGIRCKSCAMIELMKISQNCPNYIDGRSSIPYPLEFFKIKNNILKRDNYICQKCKITQKEHLIIYNSILSVHHINYDKQNCNEYNLISLCKKCNSEVNKDRIEWTRIFKDILKTEKLNV